MSWSKLVLNACPGGPVLQFDLVAKVLKKRSSGQNGERKCEMRPTERKVMVQKAVAKMDQKAMAKME